MTMQKFSTLRELFPLIFMVIFSVLTYHYWDWGLLKILGGIFLIGLASELDERGSWWRKISWIVLAFAIIVLGHLWVSEVALNWLELLAGVILLGVVFSLLQALRHSQPGDGSVLTFYFLGVVLFTPFALYLLYDALASLGFV